MPNNPGNDSPVRKRIDRRTKIKLFLIGIIVAWLAIFFILDLAFHGPISTLLSNRDELVKTVESFGAFAPILPILYCKLFRPSLLLFLVKPLVVLEVFSSGSWEFFGR